MLTKGKKILFSDFFCAPKAASNFSVFFGEMPFEENFQLNFCWGQDINIINEYEKSFGWKLKHREPFEFRNEKMGPSWRAKKLLG